jgi:peptidoglycan/xylan/chitin deacetylase (PgdA/CDA1 family)
LENPLARRSFVLKTISLLAALALCAAGASGCNSRKAESQTPVSSAKGAPPAKSTPTTTTPESEKEPVKPVAADSLQPPAYDGYEPLPCFTYHHVDPKLKNEIAVTPVAFEAQLKLLKSLGYQTVTTRDVVKHQTEGTALPAKPVMITFDDGWKNQYTYAAPLLDKYGFKGVFFVNPQPIGRGSAYMTRANVESLDKRGHDIESHTWQHVRLTRTRKDTAEAYLKKVRSQLTRADRWIYTVTGKQPVALCYPFGFYDVESVAMTQANGYKLGFTTEEGIADARPWDAFVMKRFTMGPQDSLSAFKTNLTGGALQVRDIQPPPGTRVVGIDGTVTVDITDVPASITNIRLSGGPSFSKMQIVERNGRKYAESAFKGARIGFRQLSMRGDGADGKRYYASWSMVLGDLPK